MLYLLNHCHSELRESRQYGKGPDTIVSGMFGGQLQSDVSCNITPIHWIICVINSHYSVYIRVSILPYHPQNKCRYTYLFALTHFMRRLFILWYSGNCRISFINGCLLINDIRQKSSHRNVCLRLGKTKTLTYSHNFLTSFITGRVNKLVNDLRNDADACSVSSASAE